MSLLEFSILLLVCIIQSTYGQSRTDIDTIEDLYNTPGWSVTCDRGYSRNVSEFQCQNRLGVNLPAEDLRGEVGFWTGCYSDCVLTYTLRSDDTEMGIRAYLKDEAVTIIKNDLVREVSKGDKWNFIKIDLAFTRTVGIHLPLLTQDTFAVLDNIYIITGGSS